MAFDLSTLSLVDSASVTPNRLSTILELGWKTPIYPAPVYPFPDTFPEDLLPVVCRQLQRDKDISTLLALQRVNFAGWRAATPIVHQEVYLRNELDCRSYFAATNSHHYARRQRARVACSFVKVLHIDYWDPRPMVQAFSRAMAELHRGALYFPRATGLRLGTRAMETIMQCEHIGDTIPQTRPVIHSIRYGESMSGYEHNGRFWRCVEETDMAYAHRVMCRMLHIQLLPPGHQVCQEFPQNPTSAGYPIAIAEGIQVFNLDSRNLHSVIKAQSRGKAGRVSMHNADVSDRRSFAMGGDLNAIYWGSASSEDETFLKTFLLSVIPQLRYRKRGNFKWVFNKPAHFEVRGVQITPGHMRNAFIETVKLHYHSSGLLGEVLEILETQSAAETFQFITGDEIEPCPVCHRKSTRPSEPLIG